MEVKHHFFSMESGLYHPHHHHLQRPLLSGGVSVLHILYGKTVLLGLLFLTKNGYAIKWLITISSTYISKKGLYQTEERSSGWKNG